MTLNILRIILIFVLTLKPNSDVSNCNQALIHCCEDDRTDMQPRSFPWCQTLTLDCSFRHKKYRYI